MGDVALLISAIASLITAISGAVGLWWMARRTSRFEREAAAEIAASRAADRLVWPPDSQRYALELTEDITSNHQRIPERVDRPQGRVVDDGT